MWSRIILFSLMAAGPGPGGTDEAGVRPLVLRINLPEYTLEVWDDGERVRAYDATIGSPRHATPTGGFGITRIEWNPWWVPPSSPWARGSSKAPPGPTNPMGRVKLQFDTYLYVHGSHKEDELGKARSHGCIRLRNEDALDLARLIATRYGLLDDDEITALERAPSRTRSVALATPVHLRITWVRPGEEPIDAFRTGAGEAAPIGGRAGENEVRSGGGNGAGSGP